MCIRDRHLCLVGREVDDAVRDHDVDRVGGQRDLFDHALEEDGVADPRLAGVGSGGGIDVILSAKRVGETGLAFGLDMTDEMLALAGANAGRRGSGTPSSSRA